MSTSSRRLNKALYCVVMSMIALVLSIPFVVAEDLKLVSQSVTVAKDTAVIDFSTNKETSALVGYGIRSFTTNPDNKQADTATGRLHSVTLENLKPDTFYHYRMFLVDALGKKVVFPVGKTYTFKTLDGIAPHKIEGLATALVGLDSVSLTWKASRDSDTRVYRIYRDGKQIAETAKPPFVDKKLKPGTQYQYRVSSLDTAGKESPKSDTLRVTTKVPDTSAPRITKLAIVNLGTTSATIALHTNELATVTIAYGRSADALNSTVTSNKLLNERSVVIQNLVKDATYFYKVTACDADKNCDTSELKQFIAGGDITAPFINVNVPQYDNRLEPQYAGTTEPFASLFLYVNGRLVSSIKTDKSGAFRVRAKGLVQHKPNVLRFEAKDASGNVESKQVTVHIDAQVPKVTLDTIPDVVKDTHLKITGTVSEAVGITSFVGEAEDTVAPARVTGLKATKTDTNAVSLDWNKIDGARWYVVYRDNVPIAVISESKYFNTNLNSGASYSYEVSAMNAYGLQGGKSATLGVTTKAGGSTPNHKMPAVDVASYASKARPKPLDANGQFALTVQLREGVNKLTLHFADKAGNLVTRTKTVVLDTKPPVILSPKNLQDYSPIYVQSLVINGRVDTPGATVFVTVNDRKSSKEAVPTSLTGAINYFRNIGDSYKAKADADGKFSVRVMLDRIGPSKLREDVGRGVEGRGGVAATGDAYEDQYDAGSGYTGGEGDPSENYIKIYAVDGAGHVSDPLEGNIRYEICGEGGDWTVFVEDVTPPVIYSEHLMRGIAQFGFNLKLKYNGDENKVALSKPKVIKYRVSSAEERKRHSYLLNKPTQRWSDDHKSGHVLFRLTQWPGDERDLSEVDNFRFPVMVEIDYTAEKGGQNVTLRQRHCMDTSIALEKRLDVEGHIPKEFLKSSISAMDQIVKGIDSILGPLNQLQTFLFWTCLASWVFLFFRGFSEQFQCFGVREQALNEVRIKAKYPGATGKGCTGDNQAKCQGCAESIQSGLKYNNYMQWICDRIFCPSAPTLAKHQETYVSPLATTTHKNACVGVSQPRGCSTPSGSGVQACEEEYKAAWNSACMVFDEWKETTKCEDEKSGFGKVFNSLADVCREDKQENYMVRDRVGTGKDRRDVELIVDKGNVYLSKGTVEKRKLAKVGEGQYTSDPAKGATEVTTRRDEKGSFVVDKKGKAWYDADQDGVYTKGTDKAPVKIWNRDQTKQEQLKLDDDSGLRNYFKGPKEYIVDPTSGFLRSVQCVCLPGIVGYLQLWRNILDAVRKCFHSILITKKAQSGLCKAVLTQYLCDLIYDVIRCVTEKYGSAAGGAGVKAKAQGGIGSFVGALSGSANSVQSTIQNRYGKTNLYQAMFTQKKLIHAICLGAFTGDFDFDVAGLLASEGRIAIRSEAFMFPTTRRYITADPTQEGRATFMYHIGMGIVAGSDIDWRVDLVCSNDNSCPESGNPNDYCDCALGKDPREETYRIDAGRLRAGETLGGTADEGDRYIPLTDRFRYDKVRLKYSFKDNEGKKQEEVLERKLSPIGVDPPAGDCKFYPLERIFRCNYAIGDRGFARFLSDPEPKEDVYYPGDRINAIIELEKRTPNFNPEAVDFDQQQIPFRLVWQLYNQNRVPLKGPIKVDLVQDGIWSDVSTSHRLLLPRYEIKATDFGVTRSRGTASVIPTFDIHGERKLAKGKKDTQCYSYDVVLEKCPKGAACSDAVKRAFGEITPRSGQLATQSFTISSVSKRVSETTLKTETASIRNAAGDLAGVVIKRFKESKGPCVDAGVAKHKTETACKRAGGTFEHKKQWEVEFTVRDEESVAAVKKALSAVSGFTYRSDDTTTLTYIYKHDVILSEEKLTIQFSRLHDAIRSVDVAAIGQCSAKGTYSSLRTRPPTVNGALKGERVFLVNFTGEAGGDLGYELYEGSFDKSAKSRVFIRKGDALSGGPDSRSWWPFHGTGKPMPLYVDGASTRNTIMLIADERPKLGSKVLIYYREPDKGSVPTICSKYTNREPATWWLELSLHHLRAPETKEGEEESRSSRLTSDEMETGDLVVYKKQKQEYKSGRAIPIKVACSTAGKTPLCPAVNTHVGKKISQITDVKTGRPQYPGGCLCGSTEGCTGYCIDTARGKQCSATAELDVGGYEPEITFSGDPTKGFVLSWKGVPAQYSIKKRLGITSSTIGPREREKISAQLFTVSLFAPPGYVAEPSEFVDDNTIRFSMRRSGS